MTLLTDFGNQDSYVGQMKGVILSIDLSLRIVDLTHEIAPQDIARGSFELASAVPQFPTGTVHVAVVDPGVGTDRRAIVLEYREHLLVGPDNGLFDEFVDGASSAFEISNRTLMLESVTGTFHGRDIFAPVGARLASSKITPMAVGSPLDLNSLTRLKHASSFDAGSLTGTVVAIDRFGNCVTRIRHDELALLDSRYRVTSGKFSVELIAYTYSDVAVGEALALIGSSGTVELSVRNGNASSDYGINVGDTVRLDRIGGAG